MRLKEMTTDQATKVLVMIAEPAAEIMEDEKALQMIEKMGKMQHATNAAQIAFLIRYAVPLLLRDHKIATYTVLSAMTGKSVDEIGAQNINDTLNDIQGCLDRDLIGFFTSAADPKKAEGQM